MMMMELSEGSVQVCARDSHSHTHLLRCTKARAAAEHGYLSPLIEARDAGESSFYVILLIDCIEREKEQSCISTYSTFTTILDRKRDFKHIHCSITHSSCRTLTSVLGKVICLYYYSCHSNYHYKLIQVAYFTIVWFKITIVFFD